MFYNCCDILLKIGTLRGFVSFIIYYVMKYRKILIKYNAYISQPWKYKNLYFHSSENTRFDIFTGQKP